MVPESQSVSIGCVNWIFPNLQVWELFHSLVASVGKQKLVRLEVPGSDLGLFPGLNLAISIEPFEMKLAFDR